MTPVRIVGGGPAGSAAALAGLDLGAPVTIYEKANFPRHKVCGEFFSPETAGVLERLGVQERFFRQRPASIRRLVLSIEHSAKTWRLPEAAYGLSRYTFDCMLLEAARERGAAIERGRAAIDTANSTIVATGRNYTLAHAGRGNRLFGFKAHFDGPIDDAVELYFFSRCYVGVSSVEDGRTNVCGLAPEDMLRRFDFEIDRFLATHRPLFKRLEPLRRAMEWVHVGPLVFRRGFQDKRPGIYPVGDALCFVDPFTGSGMLSAMLTGALGGQAAARGEDSGIHLERCAKTLRRPFMIASLLRRIIESGWAERLLPVVPSWLLFHVTRPGKLRS